MGDFLVTAADLDLELKAEDVAALDIFHRDKYQLHLLHDNKGYDIQLIETDFANKKLVLLVSGNTYRVSIADALDRMVENMGLLAVDSLLVNEITAPIPGLIIAIQVEKGQEIKEGDPLLVLSAMKMENTIAAPNDGVVKSIAVALQEAVEKGQLLIEME